MCRRCNLLLSKVKYRDYWYSSLPAHTSKQVCREKPDLLHFPSHFVLWSFDGWILQQQYGIARQSARTPGTPRLGPLGGGRWTQTPPDSLSLSRITRFKFANRRERTKVLLLPLWESLGCQAAHARNAVFVVSNSNVWWTMNSLRKKKKCDLLRLISVAHNFFFNLI